MDEGEGWEVTRVNYDDERRIYTWPHDACGVLGSIVLLDSDTNAPPEGEAF